MITKRDTKHKQINQGEIVSFRLTNKILYQLYNQINDEDKFEYSFSLDKKKKRVLINFRKIK